METKDAPMNTKIATTRPLNAENVGHGNQEQKFIDKPALMRATNMPMNAKTASILLPERRNRVQYCPLYV